MDDATPATPKKKKHGYTPEVWEPVFLAVLRNRGNVRAACEAAGIARSTAYRRRDASKTFFAQWDEVLADAIDTLEDAAWKRAVEGTTRERPIFYKDEQVGTEPITEYSDTLAIFLLKAHRPEKYRETNRTINLNVTPDELGKMSDDDLERLEQQLARTR